MRPSASCGPTLTRLLLPFAMVLSVFAVGRVGHDAVIDSHLAREVPAAIRADGVVIVATDPTYEPNQFRRPGSATIIGVDADLTKAVMQRLGLRVVWRPAPASDIVRGVRTGEFELGVSAIPVTDTTAAEVTLVSYLQSGTRWITRAERPAVQPGTACGQKVGVVTATVQVDDLKDRSHECAANGEPAIDVVRFPTIHDAENALLHRRVSAVVTESHVGAYLAHRSAGSLRQTGPTYDPTTFGMVTNPQQRTFAVTIQKALTRIIEDGTYTRILTRWGVKEAAVNHPTVIP